MTQWPAEKAGYTDVLTNAEYHGAFWAVSSSYLKTMLNKCQTAAMAPHGAPTPSQLLGTAIHTRILEGSKTFDAVYVERPADLNARTKAGKAWIAEQEKAGREVLTAAEAQTVRHAHAAVADWPEASGALRRAPVRERSIFWQDTQTGVWCRCRPDAYGYDTARRNRVTLVDLKTCADLSQFPTDAAKYAYDVQLAFYLRGLAAAHPEESALWLNPEAVLMAVETKEPYRVGVYTLSQEMLAEADSLVDMLLWRCAASGQFGGRSEEQVAAYRQLHAWHGNEFAELVGLAPFIERRRQAWIMECEEDMHELRSAGLDALPF